MSSSLFFYPKLIRPLTQININQTNHNSLLPVSSIETYEGIKLPGNQIEDQTCKWRLSDL